MEHSKNKRSNDSDRRQTSRRSDDTKTVYKKLDDSINYKRVTDSNRRQILRRSTDEILIKKKFFDKKEIQKILVVDDEDFSRIMLQKIMQNFGECEVVNNGKDAIKIALSETPPDIILLDVSMPKMDGYEVCKILKSNIISKEIPVIFVTGNDTIEEKTKGFELGAVDYITKPFHKDEVIARVKTQLFLKMMREILISKNIFLEDQMFDISEKVGKLEANQSILEVIIQDRTKELRESEKRYRSMFDKAPDGIYILDLEGNILNANQSISNIIGYSIKELKNMNIHDLDFDNDLKIHQKKIKEGKCIKFEISQRCKNKEIKSLEVSASILVIGDKKYIQAFQRDISDRKNLEKKIEEQSEMYENLQNEMTELVNDMNNFNEGKSKKLFALEQEYKNSIENFKLDV